MCGFGAVKAVTGIGLPVECDRLLGPDHFAPCAAVDDVAARAGNPVAHDLLPRLSDVVSRGNGPMPLK